jgi:hypothetical protein
MANVRYGSRTVAIEVFFSFKFAVVFDFNLFSVPPSKAKPIGDGLTNRQNEAIRSMFFLYYYAHCLLTHRIILHYKAMRGEEKKNPRSKLWKI